MNDKELIGKVHSAVYHQCQRRGYAAPVDMLVLDGRDERLKFLGLDGILTAACCPNCVPFAETAAFNRFTLDGGSEVIPTKLFDDDTMENYLSPGIMRP